MIEVKALTIEQVRRNWGVIGPLLEHGLQYTHGELSAVSILAYAESRRMDIILVKVDDRPKAFCVTEIVNYPEFNAVQVVLLTGVGFKKWSEALIKYLEAMAQMNDCARIQASVHSAMGRMLRRQGFEQLYSFVGRGVK